MPLRSYLTGSLQHDQEITRWVEHMENVYYKLEVSTRDSRRFVGSIQDMATGELGLSSIINNAAAQVRRQKRDISSGEPDQFILVLPQSRSCEVSQGRKHAKLKAGEAFLLNTTEPYTGLTPSGFSNITIKLPGHLLRSRLPWIDDACARSDAAAPELASVTTEMIKLIMAQSIQHVESHFESALLSLVAVMLDAGRYNSAAHGSAEIYPALQIHMLEYMERHLGHSDLRLDQVAGACNISVRTAQKVFQRHDTNFGRELLRIRLNRAKGLLSDHNAKKVAIGEIAYACGFISQPHFSRSFREAFGCTPRDARNGNGLP